MNIKSEILEIDRTLDLSPGQYGWINRNKRRTLNRRRKRLLRMAEGRDARWECRGWPEHTNHKRAIVRMMKEVWPDE